MLYAVKSNKIFISLIMLEFDFMKIVHVIDHFQPHLGYQETYLAIEHHKAGHDVHVVTSNRFSPAVPKQVSTTSKIDEIDKDFKFKIHRLPLLAEYRTRVWLYKLEEKIRSLEPDLIIMHGMASFTAIRVALTNRHLKGTKVIFDFHSNYVNSTHQLRKYFYMFYRYLIFPVISRNANAVVAVDDNSKKFLVNECGFSPDKINIIPLGADDDIFQFDASARQEIRKKIGIDPTDIVGIFSGRLTRVKDVNLLIEAGLAILGYEPRLRILIVGDGDTEYINEMKSRIRDAGQEDKFYWSGFLSSHDLAKFYSASDIAIWPKQVSIGTLEAQSCSLPLIVANTPMLAERVMKGNGLIFETGSVASLQEKLDLLITNDSYRKQLGRRGKEIVEKELNWNIIAHKFIELV